MAGEGHPCPHLRARGATRRSLLSPPEIDRPCMGYGLQGSRIGGLRPVGESLRCRLAARRRGRAAKQARYRIPDLSRPGVQSWEDAHSLAGPPGPLQRWQRNPSTPDPSPDLGKTILEEPIQFWLVRRNSTKQYELTCRWEKRWQMQLSSVVGTKTRVLLVGDNRRPVRHWLLLLPVASTEARKPPLVQRHNPKASDTNHPIDRPGTQVLTVRHILNS